MFDTEGPRMRVSVLVGFLVMLSLLAPTTIIGIEEAVMYGDEWQNVMSVYWIFVYGHLRYCNQQLYFHDFFCVSPYTYMSLLWVSIGLIISLALLFDKFPQSSTTYAWFLGMIALGVQLTSALSVLRFLTGGPTFPTLKYFIPIPLQSILLLVFLAYDWRSRRHRLPNNDRF
jgi:hypothetical protein